MNNPGGALGTRDWRIPSAVGAGQPLMANSTTYMGSLVVIQILRPRQLAPRGHEELV
jgi:hypothetical protein